MELMPLRLAYSTVEEYVANRAMQARDLGCSEEYIARLCTQLLERSRIPLTELHVR